MTMYVDNVIHHAIDPCTSGTQTSVGVISTAAIPYRLVTGIYLFLAAVGDRTSEDCLCAQRQASCFVHTTMG